MVIDTEQWQPLANTHKTTDFLIYDKIFPDAEKAAPAFKPALLAELQARNLTCEVIRYGEYVPKDFQKALSRCKAMIFLSETESQGIAYQECLSSGVPVFAWNRGWWLDPLNAAKIPASSVPYFDDRCGMKFDGLPQFKERLGEFMEKLHAGKFSPRDYILENLTLEKCAQRYLDILEEVHGRQKID
jgi:glycosyltransferase involved in cell wall biosynthesis